MKKVIYFMGVDWGWIFQRPHIIADFLDKEVDLTVVCTKQPFAKNRQNNVRPNHLIELVQIPFQEKIWIMGVIARAYNRYKVQSLKDYDIIWIGYPMFERMIPKEYVGKIVYDCMDNFEAIYPDQSKRGIAKISDAEKRLLGKSDIVFASSQKLIEKLNNCISKKIYLVRNGYIKEKISEPRSMKKKDKYVLGYIGTVSEWFDFDTISNSLLILSNIEYRIIGPVVTDRISSCDKIVYEGVVEHSDLVESVEEIDCLIMPFVVNDIIQYVDPVKLYEYISWGRCIVACWYPEIDRFEDFVYFYHNKDEYVEIIKELISNGFMPKYTKRQQIEFLNSNSWNDRFAQIKTYLEL